MNIMESSSTPTAILATITISVEDCPLYGLFDSGSSVSAIAYSVICSMWLNEDVDESQVTEIKSATRYTMLSCGSIELRVEAFDKIGLINTIVLRKMPSGYDYILGWPEFLQLFEEAPIEPEKVVNFIKKSTDYVEKLGPHHDDTFEIYCALHCLCLWRRMLNNLQVACTSS